MSHCENVGKKPEKAILDKNRKKILNQIEKYRLSRHTLITSNTKHQQLPIQFHLNGYNLQIQCTFCINFSWWFFAVCVYVLLQFHFSSIFLPSLLVMIVCVSDCKIFGFDALEKILGIMYKVACTICKYWIVLHQFLYEILYILQIYYNRKCNEEWEFSGESTHFLYIVWTMK